MRARAFYRTACVIHEYLATGLPDLVYPLHVVLSRISPLLTAPMKPCSRSRMREHYAEIVASCAWVDLFLRELDFSLCLSFAWQSV